MRDQLVAEPRHILRLTVEPVDQLQRFGGIFVDHTGGKVVEIALVGKSCRCAHHLVIHAVADGDTAVEQRECVSECAVGHRGDQHGSTFIQRDILLTGNIEQTVGDIARRDPMEIKPLATRLDGEHDLVDLGGRKNKNDMRGRLFQDLEQCVEGLRGEHVHLVDDVNLVAALVGRALHLVDNVTDIFNFTVRGGVHLKHVEGSAVVDLAADLTFAAGAAVMRMQAVDRLGEELGTGRLAGAA